MQDVWNRQLIALGAAALLALGGGRAFGEEACAPAVAKKLQAARLLEAALATRETGEEEWQKLERIYAELATQNPDDVKVKNARAEFLWSRGERERAVAEWMAAEKIAPDDAIVLGHLAGSWLAAGDAKKSAAYYARAIASEPANAAYHFALANVSFLFRHELLDETRPDAEAVLGRALAEFAEASRLAPHNPEYARAYAETFYSQAKPDWQAALAAWRHVLDLSPQKDFAFSNLARVHLKLGDKPSARECLKNIQGVGFERLKARIEAQIVREEEAPAEPQVSGK